MLKNLISKYTLFLYFFLSLSFNLSAQLITANYKTITLSSFLDSLASQTDINIAYDVNAIPGDSILNVNFFRVHPLEIVKEILNNCQVKIAFINDQIIISESIDTGKGEQPIRIDGHVIDANNKVSLPLVNVSVQHQPLGTITNSQGEFEFKIPSAYADSVLVFSFLGYRSVMVHIPAIDSTLEIVLQPNTVRLKEVEVTYKDPDEIIRMLKNKYKQNYWDEQALLHGFFRESIRQDGEYVQVSEAIIEIIKPSYLNPSDMERVKFIKGRKKNDLQSMDLVNFKLEGGPFQFSRVDIARYHDFFSKENNQYKYIYAGLDVLNEEIVYKVNFKPYNDNGALLYNGVLYVHAKSFALVRAEFALTKKALKTSGRSLIRRASRKLKVRPLHAKYYIDYRFYQDKWILNRIDGEIIVRINDKWSKVNSVFTAVTELLISDWQIDKKVRLKSSELFKSNYVLADQIDETDDDFWENYNIIRPDEELERVFKKAKVVPDKLTGQ